MSFHIDQKLIFESLDNSTSKTCSSYFCNPEVYHSIVCPLPCFYIFPRIYLLPELEPSPPPPPNFTPKILLSQSPNKQTLSIFLILLISVLGIAVYIFCAYVIHKFHNSRTSSQPEQQVVVEQEEFSDIRTVGLQQSVISSITIHKYKRGEGLIEGTECSVCSSEFQEDETLRILPKCNHAFHIPCIDTWLRSHTNRPMCCAGIVIALAASQSLPEQNPGPRHAEAAYAGISENATELTLDIENEDETLELSSLDSSGNSKEDVGNGTNEGMLSEFCASRRSASLESLSTASIATCASVSQSTFDGNEISARMKNLCVDRVMQEQKMIRRSQSAVLLP